VQNEDRTQYAGTGVCRRKIEHRIRELGCAEGRYNTGYKNWQCAEGR